LPKKLLESKFGYVILLFNVMPVNVRKV